MFTRSWFKKLFARTPRTVRKAPTRFPRRVPGSPSVVCPREEFVRSFKGLESTNMEMRRGLVLTSQCIRYRTPSHFPATSPSCQDGTRR